MHSSGEIIRIALSHKGLVLDFIVNDIRGRYWGSLIGLWGSVVNPFLVLFIYCFIFSWILNIKFGHTGNTENFALNVFCGLIPWMSFSEAVQRSSTVFLEHGSLIKRMYFPKEILPLYLTLSALVHQILALVVFLVVLLAIKADLGRCVLLLPIIFPLQVLFTLGFCMIVSSFNVFLRDISIFIGNILQLWMFCTPIFYPESLIPERFLSPMELNPMFHFVTAYRGMILHNTMPDLKSIEFLLLCSVLSYLTGSFVFVRLRHKIVDYL